MEPHSPIAVNLARLRADQGLTQAELAKRARISRVALGMIERGEALPRSDTLSQLAHALRVPLRELVVARDPLTGVRFRAKKRVKGREQILAEVSGWLSAYRWLESELGALKPFALDAVVGPERSVEDLALGGRSLLGLKLTEPIRDICGLLEDNGVKVLLLDRKTDAFFGLSVAPGGGGPAVVVNTWERISVERWIFTAAHELGHIVLHRDSYDRSRAEEPPDEEREADRFASQLLMPDEAFESEWEQTRGLPFLFRVLKVKRMFKVSYKTVLHRLVESGREPREVWRAFQLQHKQHFGTTLRKIDEPDRLQEGEFRLDWTRSGEPDALSESDFLQGRLSRLVRMALEKDRISLSRAAEILGISRMEMRELARSWGQ
ncbi:MAG: ImmA/IrrE family metallo-endopeptidase [Acidobacteriota bacterium]